MIWTVSDTLRLKLLQLRASGIRQYVIARRAGIHPSLLSQLITGAVPIHANDSRVLKIAAVVGVAADQAISESAPEAASLADPRSFPIRAVEGFDGGEPEPTGQTLP